MVNWMYVQELRVGVRCPDEVDRISVRELSSGQFQFEGFIWIGENLAHSVDRRGFETAVAAKEAGIEWAERRGAENLFIEYRNDEGI